MNDASPESAALIAAVHAALARAEAEMAPKLDAAGIIDPDMRMANTMQNVLRVCIAACLNKAEGMSEELPVQLATRLACYALSALPHHLHHPSAMFVADCLPDTLRERVAKGIGIGGDWLPISTGTATKQ